MLISARFQGKDIVTIREAAWLTDNTYKYEDVVRMMGEVMSCIKGQVRVLTVPDYLLLLCSLAAIETKAECIASYLGDLSMLHTEFGRYSRAEIAASAILVSNLIQGVEFPWPSHLPVMTGLQITDLFECSLHLHHKCLIEETLIDHRNVKLKAVKERYAEERYHKVSEMKIPSADEIRSLLLQHVLCDKSAEHPFAVNEHQTSTSDETPLNTSLLSCTSETGYDGDQEDEGDTLDEDTEMEEFSDFSAFGQDGVFNRPPRNSSFLGDDEFSRSGSTPSILRPEYEDNGHLFDVDGVMDVEPVRLDGAGIDSASGYHVPVVIQPHRNLETRDPQSGKKYRPPLRAIENDSNHLRRQGLSNKRCFGNRESGRWLARGVPRVKF